jgi:hypothetical protein
MGKIVSINLNGLSKPATALIEKVSDAVGGIFKPYQIKRVAQAEATATLIHAKTGIEITELQYRAVQRFVNEEVAKQENIESITSNAIPLLDDDSDPQKLDTDWVTNFFDKCRIVSDSEMQTLWSKVLAGEANHQGTYSKRTVNFLGSINRRDADLFTKLSGFCWHIGGPIPLVIKYDDQIYRDNGITFDLLNHLDDIGLIKFKTDMHGYARLKIPKIAPTIYFDQIIYLEFRKDQDNTLNTGCVLFTQTGLELMRICDATPIIDFPEYIFDRWLNENIYVSSPYPRGRIGQKQ